MYAAWKVGDVVQICVKVEDFCGTSYQQLYFYSADMQKYPDPCNITCARVNCAYSCLNPADRAVSFRSVLNNYSALDNAKCSNLSNDRTYRELGVVYTNSQGIATLVHTVTEQDRQDYLNAVSLGGRYDIVCCTNDPLAVGRAQVFSGVTVQANPCLNVICSDKCFGSDLWAMKCDPTTGQCVQDLISEINSVKCTGTHYIEYDLSFLNTSFLDLIAANLTAISDTLGTYLPFPDNITYVASDYISGKFRIYVKYTPVPGMSLQPAGMSTLALPAMSLSAFAALLAGLIIFILVSRITSILGPWGIAAAALVGVAGAIATAWVVYDLSTGTGTPGTVSKPSREDSLKTVKDYYDTYVAPFCANQHSDCAATPPTCDAATMRAYLACTQQITLCQYAAATAGDDITICDQRVQEYQDIDTGLATGSLTPQEAKTRTEANNTTIQNYYTTTQNKVTCAEGEVYDPTTQKCVPLCCIDLPVIGCVTTQKTCNTLKIAGSIAGAVIAGYIIYRITK